MIDDIGSYTISAVNDGAPMAASLDVPPASVQAHSPGRDCVRPVPYRALPDPDGREVRRQERDLVSLIVFALRAFGWRLVGATRGGVA